MIPRFIALIMPPSSLFGLLCILGFAWLQPPLGQALPTNAVPNVEAIENQEVQVELPKLPDTGDEADKNRENDPLFHQIRKMMMSDLRERFPEKEAPPSLSQEPPRPSIIPKTEMISGKEWHAIELMLQAARLLDEEASQALAAGNSVRAEDRAAVARRTRTEAMSLLQQNGSP